MKHNRIVKNFIYHTLYQILVLIAPLITAPYISRVLGATGIGIFNFSQSIASYFVLIGAVGTTLYGQREIAYVQNNPEERTRVFWEIEIFRICTSVLCTAVYFVTFGLHGEYSVISAILTIEVLATAFDISWLFMGLEEFRITVIRNTIIKVIGIALVFWLVKGPQDLVLYAVCMTVPILIGNVSLWFNLPKRIVKLRIPLTELRRGISIRIKPILALFVPQIAADVYLVLDKTMIGTFSSDIAQVGYYTQGQRIIKLLLAVVLSLGTVMLPAMSAAFASGKRNEIVNSIEKAFQFVFMLSFAIMFGIDAVAPRFVPIFFGKGYEPVVQLMTVIAPILVIIGISNVIGKQYLLPTKQQSAFTLSIVTGAAVNFILNLILIHFFDALGASIATVLAELSVTMVQCWYVRKQLPLKALIKPFVRYFIMGFIMFLVVRFVGRYVHKDVFSLFVMVGTGVIVYLFELVVTRDPMLKIGFRLVKGK